MTRLTFLKSILGTALAVAAGITASVYYEMTPGLVGQIYTTRDLETGDPLGELRYAGDCQWVPEKALPGCEQQVRVSAKRQTAHTEAHRQMILSVCKEYNYCPLKAFHGSRWVPRI